MRVMRIRPGMTWCGQATSRLARAFRVTAFTAAALAVSPGGAYARGPEGRFVFSERGAERAALQAAIEATARQLSFLVRPVARSRLRAANRIAAWVEIRIRG